MVNFLSFLNVVSFQSCPINVPDTIFCSCSNLLDVLVVTFYVTFCYRNYLHCNFLRSFLNFLLNHNERNCATPTHAMWHQRPDVFPRGEKYKNRCASVHISALVSIKTTRPKNNLKVLNDIFCKIMTNECFIKNIDGDGDYKRSIIWPYCFNMI